LCPYFGATTTLRELDLSKNHIGSCGASSILHAFRDNTNAISGKTGSDRSSNNSNSIGTSTSSDDDDNNNTNTNNGQPKLPIEMINFAHSALATNKSLKQAFY